MGAAEGWVISLAVSPMLQFHSGCENSIVYLGAAFPGTQAPLSCALAPELTQGPRSLPLSLSERVKIVSSRGCSL